MRGEGADGLVVAKKPGNPGRAKEPDDLAARPEQRAERPPADVPAGEQEDRER